MSTDERASQAPGMSGPAPPGRPSDERYQLNGTLGRGGMAIVYDATEIASGRRVALKRLQALSDPQKQQRNTELFEREYRALAQLAHPRIVEVYDYGIDPSGAYYTMELLDGGDLQQLSPLPWREACEIARDMCSALSLLHSRRLVHRDVSPRNVRRTRSGFAKLIDFGAMAPLGPSKIIVGTPPCCAPESVHLQPLDGRTDLYGLGCTLYYMLVGRHAYAARHFSALHDAWQAGFARPSELLPEIPSPLDTLVLDLMRLEPDARPPNAAEVIARFSALLGTPLIGELQVANAYLVMPTLVGREDELARVRRRLKRTTRGRGCAVLIEGESGVGRSRFLDACILDAALLGAAVLRADAEDAQAGDWGVLRALARQLLTTMPSAAAEAARPELEWLRQVVPELGAASAADGGRTLRSERAQLQAAVLRWFEALARRSALIVAVDDFHRIDEPSAALLSLLAAEPGASECLLLSVQSGAPWVSAAAQRVVQGAATRVSLSNLNREQSDALLRSLFGEVPNADTFAHRLHEIANGNPRDLLQLAQHLLERGVVRYESGAWTLAQQVDDADLPSDMAQALRGRILALRASARALGSAFALCLDQNFSLDECALICRRTDTLGLLDDLDALASAGIARGLDGRYALAQRLWAPPLRAVLDPPAERWLQAGLARVFETRAQDFRAGQHWLRAGETERALDVLVAHARSSQQQTAQRSELFVLYARSLPSDWLETFAAALHACRELGRPRRDATILLGRMIGIMPAFGVAEPVYQRELLDQLAADSGLRDWAELDPSLPPAERIRTAMARAGARYRDTPEEERVYEPSAALPLLARAISASHSLVVLTLDVGMQKGVPDPAPFAAISPALALSASLNEGVAARYSGRIERALEIYRDVLALTNQPERTGLEGSYLEITRLAVMNALAVMEACLGMPSSLTWADALTAFAANQLNAFQARLLYHLFQGNAREAQLCRQQCEKLRLQTLQLYESSSHMAWEISAHSIAEDLTQLRHSHAQIAPLAERHPAWRAVAHHTSAEYHRIRRDPSQALAAAEHALALAQPGVHPLWTDIASTHVRALDDLGRSVEALRVGEAYFARAQAEQLGYAAEQLAMLIGLCQARLHNPASERSVASALERLEQRGLSGLFLGLGYEMRARVALLRGDSEGFARFGEACRQIYCKNQSPALLAKYKRLCQDAAQRQGVHALDTTTPPDTDAATGLRLVAALVHCKSDEQRAKLALTILVRQTGARAGFLFSASERGTHYEAAVGDAPLPGSLEPRVIAYLSAHTSDGPTTSTDSAVESQIDSLTWLDELGRGYRPVLLGHHVGSNLIVMGVAVMALSDAVPFRYPAQIASAISRFWAQSGHSSMLVVSDAD